MGLSCRVDLLPSLTPVYIVIQQEELSNHAGKCGSCFHSPCSIWCWSKVKVGHTTGFTCHGGLLGKGCLQYVGSILGRRVI